MYMYYNYVDTTKSCKAGEFDTKLKIVKSLILDEKMDTHNH